MTSHAAETAQRMLVVWCPDWPVVAAVGEDASRRQAGRGVRRGLVYACSAAARAEGVRRGQRAREAQSRCPDLVVLPHDAAADRARLRAGRHRRRGHRPGRARDPARHLRAAGARAGPLLRQRGRRPRTPSRCGYAGSTCPTTR